jgi:hypothetical protein
MKKHLSLSVLFALIVGLSMSAQVHHWPLKTDLNDRIGEKHGTNNGVSFETDDTRGPVANFNGESYANLPSVINGLDEVTVTCWFRMDEKRVWSRIYTFGKGDQTEPKDVFMVIPVGGNEEMYRFTLSDPSGPWVDIDFPKDIIDIQVDTWYFSAAIVKGDSIIIYHNDTKVFAESGFTRPISTLEDTENALGKSFWPDDLWKGALSDLRIYDAGLSEAEVVALYQETLTGWTDVPEVKTKANEPLVYSRYSKIEVKLNQPRYDEQVSVYNVTGALVGQKPVAELGSLSFDTGIYLVKIVGSNVNYAAKVFVK